MESQTAFLSSLGVEILESGHRRWPEAVKAQAVAETLEPGMTVKVVAARYGVRPNQLSRWRRLAQQGELNQPGAEIPDGRTPFAQLVSCDAEPPRAAQPSGPFADGLRLVFGNVRIELAADTAAARIAEIAHALEATV